MKRIANKVALATVLYTVGGFQKIRVIDSLSPIMGGTPAEFLYEGFAKDFYKVGGMVYKWERSQVHTTEIDGDTLVFRICTRWDKY